MRTAFYVTIILFLVVSCSQLVDPILPNDSLPCENTESKTEITDTKYYFPFDLNASNGQYTIVAEIEGQELYPKYFDFFEKHGYSGNGYCWEGHIIPILEKLNPELLQYIDMAPEAGAFFAYSDSRAHQLEFAKLLSPIFMDLSKLEDYVKNADRSRIDD